MSVFSHRLVVARTMRGVTAAVIANRADITPAMLSAYENGGAVPKLEGIVRLAAALDCDIDFLAGRTDRPVSNSENACRLAARISELSEADRRLVDLTIDTVEARSRAKPEDPMLRLRRRIEAAREAQRNT